MQNFILVNIFLLAIFTSCCKVGPQSVNIWDTCTNPVAKDKNFRLGLWIQTPEYNPISRIYFVNDSILDIFIGSSVQKWYANINYKFDSCNAFKYKKYWVPQPPNAIDYDIYITSYNSDKKEWYLIKRDYGIPLGQQGDWDTFSFKKQ